MNHSRQVADQLEQLRGIIEDSKAILEWHKLRAFEANLHSSSNLFFHDDTSQQLMDKRAAFQTAWIQTTMLLQDKSINIGKDERGKFQKELNKLSMQFYYLGSDVRIY